MTCITVYKQTLFQMDVYFFIHSYILEFYFISQGTCTGSEIFKLNKLVNDIEICLINSGNSINAKYPKVPYTLLEINLLKVETSHM